MFKTLQSLFACGIALNLGLTQAAELNVTYGKPISSAVIVSFANGSSAFRPTAQQEVDLLNATQASLIVIRGRTSTNKASPKDEALALIRALSARTYLIEKGVSPLKITINFASAMDFIVDNSTPEGKSQNQRVEIELIYVPNIAN